MTRRSANGESTVFKGADGRWHGYVSMGRTDNGCSDRRHVTGQRRADVVTKVRDLEAKRDGGLAAASGKAPTVEQWLEHWVTTIAVRRVRPSTLRWYETVVHHHLVPPLGHHRLDRSNPSMCRRCTRVSQLRNWRPRPCFRCTGCCPEP